MKSTPEEKRARWPWAIERLVTGQLHVHRYYLDGFYELLGIFANDAEAIYAIAKTQE